LEDGNLYLRLQKMLHTIYAAKLDQTIIHQHVHLRRKSQSHAPAPSKFNVNDNVVCFITLQICRKYKLSEATAFLLEKAGDIQGAFGIILEVLKL
jgi:hypothetical protein